MNQNSVKVQRIREVLKEHPGGMNVSELVKKLHLNKNSIGRYLDTMLASGQVEMRRFGMAKVYTLSHRVTLPAMLSISSDFILLFDGNLFITQANEPLVTVLGIALTDLPGKNIRYSPLAAFFDEGMQEMLARLVGGLKGEAWEGEVSGIIKDRAHTFWGRVTPTVFEDGQRGVSLTLSDITLQKERDEQIRFQADLLRDMGEAVIATDPEGRITYWNRAAEKLFRFKTSEVLGKDILWFVSFETLKTGIAIMRDLRRGRSYKGEQRAIRKDRSLFEMSLSIAPRYDSRNEITGFVGIFSDVTRQKQIESQFRESEVRYHTLFDYALDGIALFDLDATVLMINRASARMFGIADPDMVIGTNALEFVAPSYRARVIGYLKEIREGLWGTDGMELPVVEYEARTADGRMIWVECCGSRVAFNGIPRLLVSIRDITERKLAEEIIRKSEEKYRMLFNNANDLILFHGFDDEGMPGQLMEVNDTACAALGYTREELLAMRPQDLYLPEFLPKMQATLEQYRTLHHVTFDRAYRAKNGSTVEVEISAHRFIRDGQELVLQIARIKAVTRRRKKQATQHGK